MSIRPIDLQTLYSQLNQAGKEQAVEKNAAALQQAQHIQSAEKQAEQKDKSINRTEKTDENLDSVGDRENRSSLEAESQGKKEQKPEEKKQDFFEDPDLGHNLDITG